MSKILINQYYNNLDRAVQFGKSKNEQSIRNHFWNLLNDYARKQNYEVVTEVSSQGTRGVKVRPDGILKNLFGLDIGLWESKDEKDNIDDEIDAKLKKGYPFTNILFEDSQIAVLFQRGEEIQRTSVRDADKLHGIITQFISFKSDTVYRFEDALENFKSDIPVIVETLRKRIDETRIVNSDFIKASEIFLKLCQAEINPDIDDADIREMMIQHILTSDIFNKIFDDPEFHRHNNIALELEKLIGVLFTYSERRNLLGDIEHYYDAINSTAAGITDHHEKQKFLKVLYETFYKKYNPKAADRLGVVYTPNEIVQFMVKSTDYLLNKHFNKTLADKNVDIVDPATGTGTFITSIIDHIPQQHLAYKYKNELHANEVAILPYYVANLNIEFTYKQKMGYYEEFKNICFVDTLDNTNAFLKEGKQQTIFGLTSINTERIKNQNNKHISIIIGNPPYNANQRNFNDFNKNREYPYIDKRIKDSYIKLSRAKKTKAYDMYIRFFRWASDRIDKNGIICFVSNNSFLVKDSFDGFRKTVGKEYSDIYIINLAGDLRSDKEGNVFGIKVGVSISFFVKNEKSQKGINIHYNKPNFKSKLDKIEYLRTCKFASIPFYNILPDANNNWLNHIENDSSKLLSVYVKGNNSLFSSCSNAISTNRDEWVIDFNKKDLLNKAHYTIDQYNSSINIQQLLNGVKWSRDLKNDFETKKKIKYDNKKIASLLYRPYVKKLLYFDRILCDVLTANHFEYYGQSLSLTNPTIIFSSGQRTNFSCLASDQPSNLDVFMPNSTKCLPLYRYSENGDCYDNITDWAHEQFSIQYKDVFITKEDIFNYIYAVLHNPTYLKEYELNLKHGYPRIPFYQNFHKWSKWGKDLIYLHLNFEQVPTFNLIEHNNIEISFKIQNKLFDVAAEPESLYAKKPNVKVKLKTNKESGIIEIDELTSLSGVPKEAWEYKIGHRSALEWVLDQYKEKKPGDPTIAEKFNKYRFSDYKTQVIDLLKRICTVSVETMRIISEMEKTSS